MFTTIRIICYSLFATIRYSGFPDTLSWATFDRHIVKRLDHPESKQMTPFHLLSVESGPSVCTLHFSIKGKDECDIDAELTEIFTDTRVCFLRLSGKPE